MNTPFLSPGQQLAQALLRLSTTPVAAPYAALGVWLAWASGAAARA